MSADVPPSQLRELAWIEPVEAARRLAGGRRFAWIDSSMAHPDLGRWSHMAVDPAGVFRVADGIARWNDTPLGQDPLPALRGLLAEHRAPHMVGGPPFQAGAIGCFHYEAASLFDDAPVWPCALQIDLAFYHCVLAFDLVAGRLFVTGPGAAGFAWPPPLAVRGAPADIASWRMSVSRAAYEAQVEAVIEAIRDGSIFQANLSHRFTGECHAPPDALETYLRLRAFNPAPFSALLVDGGRFVASTSPERFLRLDGQAVETRPIKGTIRRHPDPIEDAARAKRLCESEKDRAENIMIVDLMRNDLSRVALPDSVSVDRLCAVESYERLHHLVSVVSAVLKPGKDALDLIAACFPGGSITGAPKLKAMEIIARHERQPRGIYCGSIGWIGFDGAMDMNIAIRTVSGDGTSITLNAGGGITLLSNPASEYDETLLKAETLRAALSGSGDKERAA